MSISHKRRPCAAIPRRTLLGAALALPVLWGLPGLESGRGPKLDRIAAGDEGAMVTIVRFDSSGEKLGPAEVPRVAKSDAQWRRQLTTVQYWITRRGRDEPAFAGSYATFRGRGIYDCVCCGNAVFGAQTKYDAGTGWPSFWAPLARENIWTRIDRVNPLAAAEVLCRQCDAHLGALYKDGPPPTRQRYSINSAALVFVAATSV